MSKHNGAEHHQKAAEHHENAAKSHDQAAKHHREAAKHHTSGNHIQGRRACASSPHGNANDRIATAPAQAMPSSQ